MAGAAGTRGSARRPTTLLAGLAVNLLGAGVVVFFARATIRFYVTTHRVIGAVFIVQQVCVAAAFLLRRFPNSVSRRARDWAPALGGSFGGFLLRPGGFQPASSVGLILQILGLAAWTLAFFALGRSFGLVAADRGVVTRGPYAVVRHPLYTSYMVTQFGYFLQSVSAWNAAVLTFTWTCQVARTLAEEHLLADVPPYVEYRGRVRWRLMPWVW